MQKNYGSYKYINTNNKITYLLITHISAITNDLNSYLSIDATNSELLYADTVSTIPVSINTDTVTFYEKIHIYQVNINGTVDINWKNGAMCKGSIIVLS